MFEAAQRPRCNLMESGEWICSSYIILSDFAATATATDTERIKTKHTENHGSKTISVQFQMSCLIIVR